MKFSLLKFMLPLACAILLAGCASHVRPLQASAGAAFADLNAPPEPGQGKGKSKPASAEDDANIARITALLLDQRNYVRLPNHEEISSKLLDSFLDALDPMHIYFLQSDLKEFEPWRTTLEDMLLKSGDITPAEKILDRFRERLDQQSAYADAQLKTEKFAFDSNDVFVFDRKKLPRPKDMDEAKSLWRELLRYEYLQEKMSKQKPDETIKTLNRRYTRTTRRWHDYDNDDLLQLYLITLSHVYDPHSDYYGKAAQEDFDINYMRLSLVGIGASLVSEDGYCKVSDLLAGGPAIKSGKLKVGDRIVAVAQGDKEPVDVVDMKLTQIVEMIRGEKGTTVRLTVVPAESSDTSTRKVIALVRDQVKLEEQEAKARLIETHTPDGKTVRLGVIELPSFYANLDDPSKQGKSTTHDIAKLLTKLKAENINGLILDLRNNGGGLLKEAVRLTGLFIKKGPVVQVRNISGHIDVLEDTDPSTAYDGPMIVMTNRLSASASEILAGALQDYGRAVIVGDSSTFGKGTVQAQYPLDEFLQQLHMKTEIDPGTLHLTIQQFFRPGGSSTQLKGVVPDIVLPSLTNYLDYSEKMMDNPLPWDSIPASSFDKVGRVQPFVATLKQLSDARIASDKDFIYLNEEIERLKKLKEEKSVSLNEAQRMKEKQETEARLEARKKDLASRPASKDKVYLLTLALADQPGLPAPLKGDTPDKPNSRRNVSPDDDPTAQNDTKVTGPDILLNETEHILVDLVNLSKSGSAVH